MKLNTRIAALAAVCGLGATLASFAAPTAARAADRDHHPVLNREIHHDRNDIRHNRQDIRQDARRLHNLRVRDARRELHGRSDARVDRRINALQNHIRADRQDVRSDRHDLRTDRRMRHHDND